MPLTAKERTFLLKTREWMYNDLINCLIGRANMVAALALSVYTEAFGHMLIGERGKDTSQRAYEAYLKYMGECYASLLKDYSGKIYYRVRCGLSHEYLMHGSTYVNMGPGNCGIEVKNNIVYFNIVTYFNDFFRAVDIYINVKLTDKTYIKKFRDARSGEPIIA